MGSNNFDASPVSGSIPFDNSTNGFIAQTVQAAIEEVDNAVITNLYTTEVTATADTTTTSTSDVLINAMTITPPAGTYLTWFSTSVDHSNQSVAIVLSIYVGGVLQTASVRSPITRPNALGANSLTQSVGIQTKVVANGSQAIEARWKTASGTATSHQRTITILRVT